MTLGRKTLLSIGLICAVFIAFTYVFSSTFLLHQYLQLEDRFARQNVERVRNAISQIHENLKASVQDYSKWDDTCDFIRRPTEEYTRSNLNALTFADQKLNLVVVLDLTGRIVFQKAMDWRLVRERPMPQGLEPYLDRNGPLFRPNAVEHGTAGIFLLPENPLLMVSVPVLTSEGKGPARGLLLFARFLDTHEIRRLENVTQLAISVLPGGPARDSVGPHDPATITITPRDENRLIGDTLYYDVLGKPAFRVRVDMPRDIYRQGKNSVRVLVLALLLAGLVLGALMLILLKRLVLSRLSQLNRHIRTIGVTRNTCAHVTLEGTDELTELGNALNTMLVQLTDYHDKLRALASQLSLVEERERRRLAADLHDGLGQILAVLKIKLSLLRQAPPEKVADLLDDPLDLLQQGIEYTRTLALELCPPALYELGLGAAIEWLAERLHNDHGLQVTFEKDAVEGRLGNDLRTVLFQATRELLMNVIKHAGTRHAVVRWDDVDGLVRITVTDNGAGFDGNHVYSAAARGDTFGLFSIRERLSMMGGRVQIDSAPGRGTRVTLTAPRRDPASAAPAPLSASPRQRHTAERPTRSRPGR